MLPRRGTGAVNAVTMRIRGDTTHGIYHTIRSRSPEPHGSGRRFRAGALLREAEAQGGARPEVRKRPGGASRRQLRRLRAAGMLRVRRQDCERRGGDQSLHGGRLRDP